jgi:membrane associated rhomboid family serine protease
MKPSSSSPRTYSLAKSLIVFAPAVIATLIITLTLLTPYKEVDWYRGPEPDDVKFQGLILGYTLWIYPILTILMLVIWRWKISRTALICGILVVVLPMFLLAIWCMVPVPAN